MKTSVRTGVLRRGAVAIMLAGVLVAGPAAVGSAAEMTPTSRSVSAGHALAGKATAKAFANCTALNKVHKGGVAKAGVKFNKVSGKNKPLKVKPTSSTPLYKANIKMDRDKDGIACEKG
ncbi:MULTISPECIES: excalibur calcium-binding domain-containing protein [unclassified Microbacterium]|uniref:excalibur calcium-binding domain-containing protein n=1 Tax=unclassified Microbacterium TaxID=2609290 RepID=UPI00386B4C82